MIDCDQFLETIFEGRDEDENVLVGRLVPGANPDDQDSWKTAPHGEAYRALPSWFAHIAHPAIY